MHLAYIWIVSHLSAKNYRNWWKFDEVITKTNLLSFFGTRCILYMCKSVTTTDATCLEQQSMQEQTKQQEEVVRCVHVLALNTNDTWNPEWTDGRLVLVVPWKTTELENVLHQDHHLHTGIVRY